MDKRGNVKWKHTVDTLWEFAVGANNELSRMVNENIKLVYWRIWGLSHTFDCEICKQHFQVDISRVKVDKNTVSRPVILKLVIIIQKKRLWGHINVVKSRKKILIL